MQQPPYSKYTLLGIILVILVAFHWHGRWQINLDHGGDAWGYYVYLPATFLHHDLDNLKTTVALRNDKDWTTGLTDTMAINIGEASPLQAGSETVVIKYTMGVAILQAPFFAIGHLAAKLMGYKTNGFTLPYFYMVNISCLFYLLLALIFLRKSLRFYFSETVSSWVLAGVFLGTNLFYFAIHSSPMAHAYLFSLYALLIYCTILWYQTGKRKYAIFIGLLCGFITLIRPVEIICLAIPLLWGITSITDFKNRFSFIASHWKSYLLAVLCYVLAGMPQLIYWKWVSGHFLYYSYAEEGFDFTDPHLLLGIFGLKNGWLFYTPIMFLALLGVVFMRKQRHILLPVLVVVPIHIYITYSWWCWNYVNGFGSRPMVDIYALLAFPLGFLLLYAFQKKWLKYALAVLITSFIGLNLFQTYQSVKGIIWTEDSNWAYYVRSFGKTDLTYLDNVVFDSGEPQPNPNDLVQLHTVYFQDFDSLATEFRVASTTAYSGQYLEYLAPQQNSTAFEVPIKELHVEPGDWLRVSVVAQRDYWQTDLYRMSQLVAVFELDGYKKWRAVRLDNKVGVTNNHFHIWSGSPGVWSEVYFFIKVPREIKPEHTFRSYVNASLTQGIYIDDHKVEVWLPRTNM